MHTITDELPAYPREHPARLIHHVDALKPLIDTCEETYLRALCELFLAALIEHHSDSLMRLHADRYRRTTLAESQKVHDPLRTEAR
jgi:hypothetical protein